MDFRRLTAKAKRIVKYTKRESWRQFCKSLSAETPRSKVWQVIKSINGKGKGSSTDVPLEVDGSMIENATTKANILAEKLGNTIGCEPDEISEEEGETISTAKETTSEDGFNSRFSMEELKENIRALPGDKATGDDEVHNIFLKNLPDHSLTELLGLINRSWRRAELPTSWKHSLVIPILKNGKPVSDPTSYRPISLISCVSKLMEKMVASRLYWKLEKDEKFKKLQSGFRKGRSTEDMLLKMEHTIRVSLVNRRVTMAVFFDLRQAFDSVNHNLMLYKVAKAGINGRMISWLEMFLKDRTFQYMVGNSKSQTKTIKRGLPQGSALSPLLFNIMMIDLPLIEGVEVMDFADDIAITTTTKTIEEAGELIERAIRAIEVWTRRWKLTINPHKSKAMCFTKQKVMDRLPALLIEDESIDWVRTFTYLGVILDAPTLTWNNHIEDVCREGNQCLNIMRALCGSNWGADRELLINIYRAYIRPKLTYGITAVASASETNLDRLERIQNAAIRIAIGARNTSPIKALQVEANILPLEEHIKENCCKTFFRMSSHSHPVLQSIREDEDARDKVWTKVLKPPFIKRCMQILEAWDIQEEDIEVSEVLLPSHPPWTKSRLALNDKLLHRVQKDQNTEGIKAVALKTIETWYREHLKIYTDGSKVDDSTTAAVWIPRN